MAAADCGAIPADGLEAHSQLLIEKRTALDLHSQMLPKHTRLLAISAQHQFFAQQQARARLQPDTDVGPVSASPRGDDRFRSHTSVPFAPTRMSIFINDSSPFGPGSNSV